MAISASHMYAFHKRLCSTDREATIFVHGHKCTHAYNTEAIFTHAYKYTYSGETCTTVQPLTDEAFVPDTQRKMGLNFGT